MTLANRIRYYFGFPLKPEPVYESGFTQLLRETNQLENLAGVLWKSRRAHQAEHIRMRASAEALLGRLDRRLLETTDDDVHAALSSVYLAILVNVLDDVR